MNKDGKLTDVTGNPLAVGNQVKISGGFQCCTEPHTGVGTVMVLHESGDWVGYASVRWREGGVSCSVPDKALKIVARKPVKLGAVELGAFALYLRREWALEALVADEDVSRVVAEYMVGLMEATGS